MSDAYWQRVADNDALQASRLGELFLAYESAVRRAHNDDLSLESKDWPSKRKCDANFALHNAVSVARAELVAEIKQHQTNRSPYDPPTYPD